MPKPFDIYSVVTWLIVLTFSWAIQFFGWKFYLEAQIEGAPNPVVFQPHSERGAPHTGSRTLGEVAQEHGVEVAELVFSESAADEMSAEYWREKYLGLGLGILGTLGLLFAAMRLEKPWWGAIVVILLGPLVITLLPSDK